MAPMQEISSAFQRDIYSHHVADDTYPSSQVLENFHDRYSHIKSSNQKALRQHEDVYDDARGITNAYPEPSTVISTLPFYFQRWLATSDSDDEDEDTHLSLTIDQDSVDRSTGYGYPVLQHSLGHTVDPDRLFREAAMSFTSEYSNLDFEDLTFVNHTVEAESNSSPISTDSSSSPASMVDDVEISWKIELTSLSLLDATKFEIGIDANGVETRSPWPWGDYTYRPPSPPRYLDFEQYAQECWLTKIKEKLRARVSERFAEKAICSDEEAETERRGEKEKGKEVERDSSTDIVAFSQVIRGRTIYNP